MYDLPENKKIILFDGVCNLCNSSVQFIIKHDQKDLFRFVSLQSDLGIKILFHLGINTKSIDSLVLYIPNKAYYIKTNAIFYIAKDLGGFIFLLYYLRYLPNFIKNNLYDFIAKRRYKWFGKSEKCIIPTIENRKKFLS